MAKLPTETTETISLLKQQSLEVVDLATAVELSLFELFGETDETIPFLHDLKNVAEDAETSFSQLSTLQLNIAKSQPTASFAMLELLAQVIARVQNRIPAWKRSIQEVNIEWNLP